MDRTKKIYGFYRDLMDDERSDSDVLGWDDQQTHFIRFEILLNNVDLQGKKILDVGCGVGALYGYLSDKGIVCDYYGVDIISQMISMAGKRHPGGKYYFKDIFKENPFSENSFDIVFASGIFNLAMDNNEEFLANAIKLFYNLGKEKVVFNLLLEGSRTFDKTFFYYSPEKISHLINKIFYNPPQFNTIDNYLYNDFTTIIDCYNKIN